jgi:type III secretory pathway component EscS
VLLFNVSLIVAELCALVAGVIPAITALVHAKVALEVELVAVKVNGLPPHRPAVAGMLLSFGVGLIKAFMVSLF